MCSHEQKTCEHCGASFECRVGNISNCQCYTVKLTDQERDFIASRYGDCICAGCMTAMKNEYHKIQQDLQLQVFFRGR
ncbi:MAG: cysteine-rich CWC family protein [Ferruginibacter sp.]